MSDFDHAGARTPIASLDRPASYWRKRANQYGARGDNVRALALIHRALALAPLDGGLHADCARMLRRAACYEASNREAFYALTLDPNDLSCLTLIARNMKALGRGQEALDAYSHYLSGVRRLPDDAWIWEDELYEVEDEMNREEAPKRRVRADTLLRIAFQRMRDGKGAEAFARLRRGKGYIRSDARLNTLYAMLCCERGELRKALPYARRAVMLDRGSVRALCALATIRGRLGELGAAGAAMTLASTRCLYSYDEQLFCQTADDLGFHELVFAMLRYNLRRTPQRLSSLYNVAVYELKRGALYCARSTVNRCRNIDPDDLPTRCLARRVLRLMDEMASSDAVRDAARELPYHPMLSPSDAVEQMMLVVGHLQQGVDPFSEMLQSDRDVYEAFVYALSVSNANLNPMLCSLAQLLPGELAQRILRDALTRGTLNEEATKHVLSALASTDAKPPYYLLLDGRLACIDRGLSPKSSKAALHRALALRLRALGREPDGSELVRHTLGLLARMDERHRYAVATGDLSVWRIALRAHASACHDVAACELPRLRSATRRRVRAVYLMLCKLQPAPSRLNALTDETNRGRRPRHGMY